METTQHIIEPDFVLYHGGCFDGFAGAYACYLKYIHNKNITYIPMSYNHEYTDEFIEQFVDKKVIMIDFSTPYDVTEKILQKCSNLLIIDHHITAQKDLKLIEEKNKIFNMNKSGVVLAYEYFFPGEEVPIGFQYIQDRDIWTWKFKEQSKPFTNALFMRINIKNIKNHFAKFEEFGEIFNDTQKLIDCGKIVIDVQNSIISCQINYTQKVKFKHESFNHFNGIILNSSVYTSEIGNLLTDEHKYDFAIIYTHQIKNDKNLWHCSIRSNPNRCDVSLIAKNFGGGGHQGASAFCIDGNLQDLFEFEKTKDT